MIIRKLFRIGPKIRFFFYLYFNRLFLKINGVDYGKNVCIVDRFYLTMLSGAKLSIGNNFVFTSGDGINPLSRNIRGKIYIAENAIIRIGNDTGISASSLRAKERITIGNNVLVGADCLIMDTDAHSLDWRIRAGLLTTSSGKIITDREAASSAPVVIEDNVMIGARCIILKGVKIGSRSIIAAGSVVTKSIPSDCIAGGNPCKVIRFLSPSE